MAEQEGKLEGIPLSEKDQRRMARLYEQVMQRTTEMSEIIAEATGQKVPEDIGKSTIILRLPSNSGDEAQKIEVPFADIQEHRVVLYKDPPGVCLPV